MRAIVVYSVAASAVWLPAAYLLRRVTGPADRLEQVVGGLFVAVGWPVTIPALFAAVLSKRRTAESAPDATIGALPHGLPLDSGRSHGALGSVPHVWRDDPSAGERYVGRGSVTPALLETPPRDHARLTRQAAAFARYEPPAR